MTLSINTNIASLNAQRNLQRSQDTLSTSLQRLSTGLRINSAKDDAAGLAISTRFTTQINGLGQAVRNANDGISLAQTGEAALEEITNNLQRIRELAVQSANATNSSSDRAALDSEVQQRIAEINRIGSQTSFNGQKLLDGSFGTAAFQVGANVGETIDVNLNTGVKSSQIGQISSGSTDAQLAGIDTSAALTDGGTLIAIGNSDPVAIPASADFSSSGPGRDANSAYSKVEAINAAGITGLTASAHTSVDLAFTPITAVGSDAGYELNINGVNVFDGSIPTGDITGGDVAAAINLHADDTGVRASFTGGVLTLEAADGRNIEINQDTTGNTTPQGITDAAVIANDGASDSYAAVGDTTSVIGGNITLSAAEGIEITGETARLGFNAADATFNIAVDSTTLDSVSVTSVDASNDAIMRIDSALTQVSDLRSTFGAVQNRFESTINNLQSISENLTASRGRILDADFAAETANLTKAQILQQAGTSVLAQANQVPQAALSLLQG
ncbi:flagellin [Spongiibacter sp. KMU-158]|uniref:Flagellin n=1 Tax=Spongiibacter pelagi TaxID=2760804 RepID=A0A927GVZ8_9GAMM|nr:flagellin [Spongiibacter pelagi]MBD2858422.1 flagellin [Spongiibacter pelagi]